MSDDKKVRDAQARNTPPSQSAMPPYPFQESGTGSRAVSYGQSSAEMDADQKKKVREAVQNLPFV